MKVLEPKQFGVLASCIFAVIGQLVTHIKRKAERVVMFYDQASGWVQTQQAVSNQV